MGKYSYQWKVGSNVSFRLKECHIFEAYQILSNMKSVVDWFVFYVLNMLFMLISTTLDYQQRGLF